MGIDKLHPIDNPRNYMEEEFYANDRVSSPGVSIEGCLSPARLPYSE
jgi:hypothetical protein